MAGRKLKLNSKIQKIIIDAIRAGHPLETASGYAKVSRSSVRSWIERGEDPKEKQKIYIDFALAYRYAEAEAVDRWIKTVEDGQRGWQSAAWLLERRHWQLFGRRELTNPEDNKVVNVVFNRPELSKDVKSDSLTDDN